MKEWWQSDKWQIVSWWRWWQFHKNGIGKRSSFPREKGIMIHDSWCFLWLLKKSLHIERYASNSHRFLELNQRKVIYHAYRRYWYLHARSWTNKDKAVAEGEWGRPVQRVGGLPILKPNLNLFNRLFAPSSSRTGAYKLAYKLCNHKGFRAP